MSASSTDIHMRRVAIPGRGFGLTATRNIPCGELLLSEMPLAVCQDRASEEVTAGCVSCLRCCGTAREALQHALSLIGEDAPAHWRGSSADEQQPSCPSCGAVFCSHACAQLGAPHLRLCAHPAGARLRELAATHSDSVWLAALCVAKMILAVEDAGCPDEQAAAVAKERQQQLGDLHHVAWEDIPRWRAAGATEHSSGTVPRSCRLRRRVVEEVSQLLQCVFPGAQWLTVTGCDCVSTLMGTVDSSAVSLYIRCTPLNAGWADSSSGGSADDKELRALIPCIHEAVVREWEDRQVAGIHCQIRQRRDQVERRAEPLWPRGFPPIDGAALYPTLAQVNHSCDANLDYEWEETCEVRVTAVRDIAHGEELTINYCDPRLPVDQRRRQLREDYGFVCTCPRCMTECTAEEHADADGEAPSPSAPSEAEWPASRSRAGEHEDGSSDEAEGEEDADTGKGEDTDSGAGHVGLSHGGLTAAMDVRPPDEQVVRSHRKAAALRIRAEKGRQGPTDWRAGETPSGVPFWSFTDGDGQPHVLLSAARPELTPAEWLAAGAPKAS